MGFREGAFATVWEITNQQDNFTKVRLSTSRKNKSTDEYVTDFSGFVSLIGEANKNAGMIQGALDNGSCRIKLGACDVTNSYNKEAQKEYTNFTLFAFEMVDGKSGGNNNAQKKDNKKSAGSTGGTRKAKNQSQSSLPLGDDDDDGDGDGNLPF